MEMSGKKSVFIDGSAGTTGLRIYDRLRKRSDIELITLEEKKRKDIQARKRALNSCDVAFLCLPDDAAREAVALVENPDVTVIDASTAHRTLEGWAYGFAELGDDFYHKIQNLKRIAVPGCHASGFIALVYPLMEKGVLKKSAALTCHSITGYSGGGKKMIAEYEAKDADMLLSAPRQYGITQNHKHLREMKKITGLEKAPIFCPIVSNFYCGMTVTVPIFAQDIECGVETIRKIYREKYNWGAVKYCDRIDEDGFISANAMAHKDSMQITVAGNDERILLIARYDNLGKGASGAAIECLNISIGADIDCGLDF